MTDGSNTRKRLLTQLEDFWYQRVVKAILFTSRLGRRSTMGYADSGMNFDHIYLNKAKGYSKFGVLVDRVLLNLPACKATRKRFDLIKSKVSAEISANRIKGVKSRIADLASGGARYLREIIKDGSEDIEVLCLDIDRRSLKRAQAQSPNKPFLYKRADVLLTSRHLQTLGEKKNWFPNIVVASGFYEYHPDEVVKDHFGQVYSYLQKEGIFFAIAQYKNPQRKLIEKVGMQKDGKQWVLHYRSPDKLKQWMNDTGYRQVKTTIDRWGQYVYCEGRK